MNRRTFGQLITAASMGQVFPRLSAQTQAAIATRGFRFSVMLWALEKQAPFDRCLEMVAAAGYEGVELTGEFRSWSAIEIRRVMARMRSLGLQVDLISGVKSGFGDPSGTNDFLSELNAQIRMANDLESPRINLKSGPRIGKLSPADQHAACVDNLKRAASLAATNNIELLIEPIDPIENPTMYMTSVSEAFAIVRDVESPRIRVLFDFYHEQRAGGNLIEKLEQNFDLVGLVHIADVPGRHQPGTGEIDYLNIYKKLAELRYDKFIAMEFYPTGDVVEVLRQARLDALQAQASYL
ncbi:MAG: TIM barrel protein [Acidobacteriota bacterium]|nr:TIM barrel protein [Acidobacteriota bacterium]